MPGPQLTGKHLLSGLCCGPDTVSYTHLPGEEVTAELLTACRALEQAGTALKHTGGSGAEEIAVL